MTADFYNPPADHPLSAHVVAIFRLDAPGGFAQESLLPRPSIGLVFNLGEGRMGRGRLHDGSAVEMAGVHMAGLRPGAMHWQPAGAVQLIGLTLHADTCAEILPLPASELTAAFVDATDLIGDAPAVRERLRNTASFAAQCRILLEWVAARRRPHARTAALRWACAQLRRDPTGASLDAIAREMGQSPRQMRRVFAERIGIGPAAFIRLQRFAAALPLMQSRATLTEVAHRAGYYDQPHFCRDFRSFAGMLPQEYRAHPKRSPAVLFRPH